MRKSDKPHKRWFVIVLNSSAPYKGPYRCFADAVEMAKRFAMGSTADTYLVVEGMAEVSTEVIAETVVTDCE